jgi:hypothetical protein
MSISKAVLALGLGAFISVAAPVMARADSVVLQPAVLSTAQPQANIIDVSDGCGWGWYRGPGGACHQYGQGPYPGGYYAPYPGAIIRNPLIVGPLIVGPLIVGTAARQGIGSGPGAIAATPPTMAACRMVAGNNHPMVGPRQIGPAIR